MLKETQLDTATGRMAALVRFKGRKGAEDMAGQALVGLADSPKGLKVLGVVDVDVEDKEAELRPTLTRIASHEVAAEFILSFHEPDRPEEDHHVETQDSELVLYHLTEHGPRSVLSFELHSMKSDVECTHTRQAQYGPVEDSSEEGFYAFRVETVGSDGGCALVYWDRSQGDPPDDLGTSREEKLFLWDGASYK